MTTLLEVSGLTKSFFGTRVLHGIGFVLQAGQALGLVGENGSGKSTTLNILGGVHQPDAGEMWLDGEPYAPQSPREASGAGVAFMHQELNLFAGLSIAENLFLDAFPRRGGTPLVDFPRIRAETARLLGEVDLELPASTKVGRLSQGERQLVELAKALSRRARVIFLDEPTTSLTRSPATWSGTGCSASSSAASASSTSRTRWKTCARSATKSRCCATARWWARTRSRA